MRFAEGGDGTERDAFLSMHWNNEIKTDVKNGAKPGGWDGVVDIEMGVGEGGVLVGGTGLFIASKSDASSIKQMMNNARLTPENS